MAITVVAGMAGIGKTELALQYSHYHLKQKTYPGGICWLPVRDEDVGIRILNYARAYLDVNPPEEYDRETQIAYCWRNWPISPDPTHEKSDILLIFDDLETYAAIENFLPPSNPRFKILITTRNQHLGTSFQMLELKVLSEATALELLASLIGQNRLQEELEKAKILCQDVGYLPLGLELMGRYLKRKPHLSLYKVQQQLKKEYKFIDNNFPEMTAQRGLEAAFELSWKELKPDSQRLACLLSIFSIAPIPWELVVQSLPEKKPEDLENIRDDLVSLSLLQQDKDNMYMNQLHQLIYQFLRKKLEQQDFASDLKQMFCKVMVARSREISDTPTYSSVLLITPIIPHLSELAESMKDWLTNDDLVWPFLALNRFYKGQGLYSSAETWCKQCLEICQFRLGNSHPYVATSLNNLANVYYSQGRYKEAEPLQQQALEMRKQLLGDSHSDIATSLNNLAELYRVQGNYEEAKSLCQRALEMRKYCLGNKHPKVAESLNNLATLCRTQRCYKEAEFLLRQALEMRRELLGDNHPDVAASLNNLAVLYHTQGCYKEAEFLLRQALEMRRELLGDNHPDVAASLNNLAVLYRTQGCYKEAEPLYLEALQILSQNLEQDHPNTRKAQDNYMYFLKQVVAVNRKSELSEFSLNLLSQM